MSDAIAFMQMSSSASGTSGLISRGESGTELRCWIATETALSPSKGSRLVRSS